MAFTGVEDTIAEMKTELSTVKTEARERTNRVDKDIAQLKSDIGSLKGSDLEHRFRERPVVYLNRFALRLQMVSDAELVSILDNAFDEYLLTDEEVEDARLADVVARGCHKQDRSPLYLVAEISSVVDAYDVERAIRRAAIVAKATKTFTLPIVGGEKIDSNILQQATQLGAGWVVTRSEN